MAFSEAFLLNWYGFYGYALKNRSEAFCEGQSVPSTVPIDGTVIGAVEGVIEGAVEGAVPQKKSVFRGGNLCCHC